MDIELRKILDTMMIPEHRKEDLRWLSRNIGIQNSGHPEYQKALRLIIKEWKRRQSVNS